MAKKVKQELREPITNLEQYRKTYLPNSETSVGPTEVKEIAAQLANSTIRELTKPKLKK